MRCFFSGISRVGLLLTIAVVGATVVHAQVSPQVAARIDSIFAPWDAPDSPGAAVGVVREGRLIFAKGYGTAQIEFGVPITPVTPFHVASEAKQFTATAVLLLAERGLLSVDDTSSYGLDAENGGFERRIPSYVVPGATSLWTTVEDLGRRLVNLEEPVVGTPDLYERLTRWLTERRSFGGTE